MRLDEVWFRYGRRDAWVLREVSVELQPGSVVVVQGRNGAGKTTLLRMLAGVARPTRGRLASRIGPVGWVPERFPAGQPFTVDGYLTAIAGIAGLHRDRARASVDRWTQRLGLDPFRQVRLAALSKGTAQKVGLAQAMLATPRLLILDEPWEGLDAATRELVPELVAEVVTAGGVAVISDHRGETGRLPDAVTWTVDAGQVETRRPSTSRGWVIEVAVTPPDDVAATSARLQAQGHQVLRVRPAGIAADALTGPATSATAVTPASGREA